MPKPPALRPYVLQPAFEAAVAYYLGCSPSFWGLVGHAIEVDRLATPTAQLAARCAHAILSETGRAPSKHPILLQRAMRFVDDGKVKHLDVVALSDLYDAVDDDGGPPPEDEVVAQLAPILRDIAEQDAVMKAIDARSRRDGMDEAIDALRKAGQIGVSSLDPGDELVGADTLAEIAEDRSGDRMQIGVHRLDAGLEGGPIRGELVVVIADSGGGKSICLTHVAAASMAAGMTVLYVTLELDKAVVKARTMAALTGVSTNEILDGGPAAALAAERWAAMDHLGRSGVKWMDPGATVDDVFAWVDVWQGVHGCPVDVLCVDYGDRLGVSRKDARKYEVGEQVFEALRLQARARGLWLWTASQSRGRENSGKRKGKGRWIDQKDVADSINKCRVADKVISINHRLPMGGGDDDVELWLFVAKNRSGPGDFVAGPLMPDFANGRLCPVPWSYQERGIYDGLG